jgi:hypothetical protein
MVPNLKCSRSMYVTYVSKSMSQPSVKRQEYDVLVVSVRLRRRGSLSGVGGVVCALQLKDPTRSRGMSVDNLLSAISFFEI